MNEPETCAICGGRSHSPEYCHLDGSRETLKLKLEKSVEAHNKVTTMISRYLVASKGHIADSWMEAFIECGAITYDETYPTGLIEPVLL